MKNKSIPSSLYLKVILLIAALAISAGTLLYTQSLVSKLQNREKQIVELYAKNLEYLINVDDPNTNLTFIFENIIKPIDFPMILTDANNEINLADPASYRNLKIDSTLTFEEQKKFLQKRIKEMDAINPPIAVTYNDSIVLQRVHYGDSQLVMQLRNYPYLQIFFAAMFILIGYISFSYIKRTEQSSIWVGMAKETAHQLGTPISSLMGWAEILKMSFKDPDRVLDISDEINNDLERLNKITNRFSKIGSTPELKKVNIFSEIEDTILYFRRRLPQTGKNVMLSVNGEREVYAEINKDLFGWVMENLIKNALDAIESKKGSIEIFVEQNLKHVEIEVKDSGKGIDIKRRKDVFRPGYSTKRRGWGLGLSLSKRIIKEYHGGKIFVKNSSPEGTTFKIILNKSV